MKNIDAMSVEKAIPYDKLVDALDQMFRKDVNAPLRHHHTMTREKEANNVLLLMPAWLHGESLGGVKIVNITPGNDQRHLPSIHASYLLFEEKTGKHLALIEGTTLTARRTAAVSALAARYLAPAMVKTLLVVGAGRVAQELPAAFKAVRPVEEVIFWNRNREKAKVLAKSIERQGFKARVCDVLEKAVGEADVISCATQAVKPILRGEWLRPGQHIDLIGSYSPHMREADDEVILRSLVYIDTDAAAVESGDIKIPLNSKVIQKDDIKGTLISLCRGQHVERREQDITLFKGVGHAAEDLAAATLVYKLS